MRYDEEQEQLDEQPDLAEETEVAAEGATGRVAFVGGLVLGALIGAGIALLVAPERGRVTRRRLARHLREAGDELRDEFDGLRAAARRRLARRRRRLRRLGRAVS
jgi:uncharacterized membrane protein YccC